MSNSNHCTSAPSIAPGSKTAPRSCRPISSGSPADANDAGAPSNAGDRLFAASPTTVAVNASHSTIASGPIAPRTSPLSCTNGNRPDASKAWANSAAGTLATAATGPLAFTGAA